MPREAAVPRTRVVELPGRGVTRVWECDGPPGAETLMLIHGVAGTAELNWGKVFPALGRHFRVVAADLRGHGDGIALRSRFRLEDCADDIAALAGVLDIPRFTAVGYSMGGIVAQLLYRRHAPLVSGLVLCSTAGSVGGSPAEQMAALAVPAMAAALRWNPMLHLMGADFFGMGLLGRIDDPATRRWARAQLSRTTLATTISAMRAVCGFRSDSWIGQVDVPAAVVITTRDQVVPPARQLALARAIPGASVRYVDADHGACVNAPRLFTRALLEACWSAEPARTSTLRTPA
jgi:pimeloyl-ACP methyl ester carboxylesterase